VVVFQRYPDNPGIAAHVWRLADMRLIAHIVSVDEFEAVEPWTGA
jgi:hypothetical protein